MIKKKTNNAPKSLATRCGIGRDRRRRFVCVPTESAEENKVYLRMITTRNELCHENRFRVPNLLNARGFAYFYTQFFFHRCFKRRNVNIFTRKFTIRDVTPRD